MFVICNCHFRPHKLFDYHWHYHLPKSEDDHNMSYPDFENTQVRDLESNQTLIAKPFPELVTSRLAMERKIMMEMVIICVPWWIIPVMTELGYFGSSFEVQEARKNSIWERIQRWAMWKYQELFFFICWQSTDQLVDQSTSQSVKRLVFRINSVDSNKCWKTICNIFQNSLENCWRRVIVAIGRQPFDLLGYLGKPGKGINLLSKILNFNVFSTKQPILEYTKQKIFWWHKWDFLSVPSFQK